MVVNDIECTAGLVDDQIRRGCARGSIADAAERVGECPGATDDSLRPADLHGVLCNKIGRPDAFDVVTLDRDARVPDQDAGLLEVLDLRVGNRDRLLRTDAIVDQDTVAMLQAEQITGANYR